MKIIKTILITIAALLFTGNILFAQNARFTTSGTIEFEKSVNTFAIIKRMYGDDMQGFLQQAFDQYKKTQPQFKVLKSTLTFSGDKTLFTPIPPENTTGTFFNLQMLDQNNTVYDDMATHTSTTQKLVFEQTFLVKDTLRKIKWKITDETRDIAGYPCRRANGLLMDSIYVVAFYTDKIPVSGGPESFSGLPGMILQVALPHENISWLAVKVTDVPVASGSIVPPKKGKPIDNKQLFDTLQSVFKNRGNATQVNFIMKSYLL
jgi:GLPGLI family protein